MKIAIAQLNFFVGDFEGNLAKMLNAAEKAKLQGADLVVYPELATCGYPPRDFLEFGDFIHRAEHAVQHLAKAANGIAIVVGSPSRNPTLEGKDLFNSAYFLENGQIKHVQHKALLPTYDVFDEYRYFEPAREFSTVEFKGKKIALSICEDLWNVGNENPLYTIVPMDEIISQQPDLIINLSASPFSHGHAAERIQVMRANVQRYKLPLFYVNQIGSQTEIIFDGGSMVMSPDGKVFEELPYWQETVRTFDLDEVIKGGRHVEQVKEKIPLIHEALVLGIRDYFKKLSFSQAILGLSGGIDSAVVAVLTARAIGGDKVRALLMPSQFSSEDSVNDARELAINLGIQYDIIPIEQIFNSYLDSLRLHFWGYPFNVAEENIQARIRGMLAMAISNKFGNILLNTTNKSEMAVGYGTLYGDLCGGLSVLADVYKTEVYELAAYINKQGIIIPENTIAKPPSAELRPNQKDSDSLPQYTILDQIIYQYIEKQQGPAEIIAQGFDEQTVRHVLRLININEFKRQQTAPVLRVSSKAFGSGRRMPIAGKYLS